jgi:hypothetical protein
LVSIPDEVNGFYNLPNNSIRSYGTEVNPTSNRNEYQESSWGKGLPERKPDNLTAV